MRQLTVTLYDREGRYPDAQATRENPLVRRQTLTDVVRFYTSVTDPLTGEALQGLFLDVTQELGGASDLFGHGGGVKVSRFNFRDIIGLQGE